MKKTVFMIAALCLTGVLIAQQAMAATYNMRNQRSHGEWASMELHLGQEGFFRAINPVAYSDGYLAVDFYPTNCREPVVSTRIETDEIQAQSQSEMYYQSDIRVDRRDIQNGLVEAVLERGDSGLYLHYLVPDITQLLRDTRNGTMVRFRISGEDIDTLYLEFGLRGSMSAINRAASMCHEIAESPEDFFRDNSEPKGSAQDFF
ncbi:hypothetical protein FEI13_01320 [Halomonas urmiana]|uniref:Uncharacterized protein n=1 Tax=Halomonas urmiana TaxID=490901 RepID=A0A5R8MLS7_9GAMM|nr:hypothetical protein [Halomonas urmiana]TLF53267.1 hypothetical protein FEI13_01320 [Halomonas urmiana]